MKKLVLGILLCIFLVFIGILNLYFSGENKKINCESFNYYNTRKICYAYKRVNLEECNNLGELSKELCAKAVFAKMKVNESYCNSLKDEIYRNICFFSLALETKNYTYCKNDCCLLFFEAKKACKAVKSLFLEKLCLAKLYKNATYCEDMDITQKIFCMKFAGFEINETFYSEIYAPIEAMRKSSLKPCENVKAKINKAFCFALGAKNLKDCEILTSDEEIEMCKLFFITKKFYNGVPECLYVSV